MDFCFLLGQADLSNSFEELAPPLQIALFLGAMSFATAALVSLTAFTRIIIVLSFVRRALSTQEIPPNQVVMGLAFFLTLFVMAPTLEQINTKGIQPYLEAQKTEETKSDFQLNDLWQVASHEIRQFMTVHTRGDDLQLFVDLSHCLTIQVYVNTSIRT
jgi:flagellar biosynthetic protein FliP